MSKWSKFWEKIASGQSDNNIDYEELVSYLERLGWETFSTGTSHRVFKHSLVSVAVNVQPRKEEKQKHTKSRKSAQH